MKINVLHIITAHVKTLGARNSRAYFVGDLILFYGMPLCGSLIVFYQKYCIDREAYEVSISVFSIFLALLLNVQVALFGIMQRIWSPKDDSLLNSIQEKYLKARRELLADVNVNISYLIVLCCLSATFFLFVYMFHSTSIIISTMISFIYIHFVLTLLMVVKRAHALFQKEYQV